jgi:hypothetical protein
VVVNGDALDLQMECGNHLTLLATSYDYFDGCQHWLYLLKYGKPIDQLRMPDEFGFIQELTVVTANEVAFGYFGTNDRWNLVLSESGFWSYSAASLLRRPNRFLLAKRHMSIRRTKGLPWSLPTAMPNPSPESTSTGDRGTSSRIGC